MSTTHEQAKAAHTPEWQIALMRANLEQVRMMRAEGRYVTDCDRIISEQEAAIAQAEALNSGDGSYRP